jgi:hypothetical protein
VREQVGEILAKDPLGAKYVVNKSLYARVDFRDAAQFNPNLARFGLLLARIVKDKLDSASSSSAAQLLEVLLNLIL